MPGAQRATIANEVSDVILRMVTSADQYFDRPSFEIRQQERQLDKLACVDAFGASILRALLVQLYGDLEESLHWTRNARKLRSSPEDLATVDRVESVIFTNLGYFSRGAKLLVAQKEHHQIDQAHLMLTSGAWEELGSLYGKFVPTEFPRAVTAVETARRCNMSLQSMGVTQDHLQAVLDLAGEVLRKHRLLFLEDQPIIRDCGDAVLYQLLIRVEPRKAIELTDEVIDGMIDRELDAPGLTFSFIAG